MDSKIIGLAALAFFSCSPANQGKVGVGVIGIPLSKESLLYNSYGIDTHQIFVVDKATNRMLGVNRDTMTMSHEFELTHPEAEHSLAVDTNEGFVVDFSKSHLQVIGMDGTRTNRPFKFQGTPVSAAYNPLTRTMVMQDDFYSVGLMKFTATGGIEASWLGGPTIAAGKTIGAGDLDNSGRLLLAMTDGSFSIVDVDQSIKNESWQSTNFTSTLTSIYWVAPDPSHADLALVSSSTVVGIVNVSTQTVVETKNLYGSAVQFSSVAPVREDFSSPRNRRPHQYSSDRSATTYPLIGHSKAGKPHLIVQTAAASDLTLYYINSSGSLTARTLKNADIGAYSKSFLSSDGNQISILFDAGGKRFRVLALRLSDDLVVLDKSIAVNGSVSMDAQSLFVNQDAPLGKLELFDLENDGVKTLEGYNFNYLRSK